MAADAERLTRKHFISHRPSLAKVYDTDIARSLAINLQYLHFLMGTNDSSLQIIEKSLTSSIFTGFREVVNEKKFFTRQFERISEKCSEERGTKTFRQFDAYTTQSKMYMYDFFVHSTGRNAT